MRCRVSYCAPLIGEKSNGLFGIGTASSASSPKPKPSPKSPPTRRRHNSGHSEQPKTDKSRPARDLCIDRARLDSNQRRQSHQIYSLARLATPEHARTFAFLRGESIVKSI